MCSNISALESLGFGAYCDEAKSVMQEAKAVAAKKRRQSTKLENLGIPEEELLRQQQELFAKVCFLENLNRKSHIVVAYYFSINKSS